MKISEMIDKLKEIKEENGDLPVYYPNTDLGFEELSEFFELRKETYYLNDKHEKTKIEYPERVLLL